MGLMPLGTPGQSGLGKGRLDQGTQGEGALAWGRGSPTRETEVPPPPVSGKEWAQGLLLGVPRSWPGTLQGVHGRTERAGQVEP